MSERLRGKVAIVTGASSGIGRAIATTFAKQGATIVCSDLQEKSRAPEGAEAGVSTHDLIAQNGGTASFVRANVETAADVESLVKTAVEKWGRLDIMVNNAGAIPRTGGPIWDTDEEQFDFVMRVNAKGTFLGCKYATAQMIKQEPGPSGDRGWVINIASVVGQYGFRNSITYVASKHAAIGITRTAALDCAEHRIHVNALCPGFTNTPGASMVFSNPELVARLTTLHPFKGMGEPEDIARAAVFLASEDCAWVTGIALNVDGGYTVM